MPKFHPFTRTVLIIALLVFTGAGCTKEASKARSLAKAKSDFESGAYDKAKIGFDWEPAKLDTYRTTYPTAATFDTSWDGASRFGHDTNLTIDEKGHIVRKGWDGDARPGELRVRLDWSGAENQAALAALLEYLKTL